MGAPPHAPGDFLCEKKVTKDSPGGTPGLPEGGTLSPLRRCRIPPKGMRKGQLDGVEFVQLKSLRGCRSLYTPASNTARAGGGGIQGGPPPCAGGPGTRRFLAYLCLLSLREKVGRGAGRSARMVGAGTMSLHQSSPGAGRSSCISGEVGAPAPAKAPWQQRKNYLEINSTARW